MDELDKTIPPQHRPAVPVDNDATMLGYRERKAVGSISVGDVIMNRYRVLSELGRGGTGVVYKCFDETAGIEVALKALPQELSHSAPEMEDIKENFQLVSSLVHQNIAISKNLEHDSATGNYYIIMECVEGEDLRRWIKRKRKEGTLTLETVLPVIRQVASALDYAHEKRIIHRDIKPGNIMVDIQGNVKILDFGLAAQIQNSMTHVSMIQQDTSGTVPYMAPEQWRGKPQSAAADQYAFAVTVYEMLAGHLPFESPDKDIIRDCVLKETPENIEGVSPSVNDALQKALAKDPKERFANCSEFAAALQATETKKTDKVEKKTAPETPRENNRMKPHVSPVLSWFAGNKIKILLLALLLICGICTFLYLKDFGEDCTFTLPGNIPLEMVYVDSGRFTMGKQDGLLNYDNEKEHSVKLRKSFWISKTEVTQAQWKAVMGTDIRQQRDRASKQCDEQYLLYGEGDNYPMYYISWVECKIFCAKLNKLYAGKLPFGYRFDLPTEAQWEYAARGGNKSKGYKFSGSNYISEVAWYYDNSGGITHRVGDKKPNELGLYDMSGNVCEWCRDWYEKGYASDPEFLRGNTGSYRVERGGCWNDVWRDCRSSCRFCDLPTRRSFSLGLRLALVRVQ